MEPNVYLGAFKGLRDWVISDVWGLWEKEGKELREGDQRNEGDECKNTPKYISTIKTLQVCSDNVLSYP